MDPLALVKQAKTEYDSKQFKTAYHSIGQALQSINQLDIKVKKKKAELHYQTLLLAGLINQSINKTSDAEKLYLEAVELNPVAPGAYKALYEFYQSIDDQSKIIEILPKLISQSACQPIKQQQYTLQYAELLLARNQTVKARQLLYPLVGLEIDEESASIPEPASINQSINQSNPLPDKFYRLFLSLHLQLDDVIKSIELSKRTERQMKKLEQQRLSNQATKEKDAKRRADDAKKKGIKLVDKPLNKEELLAIKQAEEAEAADIVARVQAKLEADWLNRDDTALDCLYNWLVDCGMGCDSDCQHVEEQAWIERKIGFATRTMNKDQSTHDQSINQIHQLLTSMRSTHSRAAWPIERLSLMDTHLFPSDQTIKHSIKHMYLYPESWMIRQSFALSVLHFDDETIDQTNKNRTAGALTQSWISNLALTKTIDQSNLINQSNPFYPLYQYQFIQLFTQFKQSNNLSQVKKSIISIEQFITDLTNYQTINPFDAHAQQTMISAECLLAEALAYRGLDVQALTLAERLFSKHVDQSNNQSNNQSNSVFDDNLRSISLMGLMKVALYKRDRDPQNLIKIYQSAKQSVKQARYQPLIVLTGCLIDYYQYQQFVLDHQENVRDLSVTDRQSINQRFVDSLTKAYGSLDDLINQSKDHSNDLSIPLFACLMLLCKIGWTLCDEYRTNKQLVYLKLIDCLIIYNQSISQSTSSLSFALFDYTDIYAYIGLYSEKVLNNQPKAVQFYQKTLSINPRNQIAGQSINRYLRSINQFHTAIAICEAAIKADDSDQLGNQSTQSIKGSVDWAYRLQARLFMKQKEYNQAISCYQHALRLSISQSTNQSLLWEELGEAYHAAGSFVAAIKAYRKAQAIDQSNTQSMFGIARIYVAQSMADQAIETLNQIISSIDQQRTGSSVEHSTAPTNQSLTLDEIRTLPVKYSPLIPSLRMLAEAHLSLARQSLDQSIWDQSIDQLEQCIKVSERCVKEIQSAITQTNTQSSHRVDPLVGIYKILADACAYFYYLPVDRFDQSIDQSIKQSIKYSYLSKADHFYQLAIERAPKVSSLHYDQSINLRNMNLLEQAGDQSIQTANKEITKRSIKSMKQSIMLSPSNPYHWIGLGLTVQSFVLRHFCFVRALRSFNQSINQSINPLRPDAWLALAWLYLQHGDAHQSLNQSNNETEYTRLMFQSSNQTNSNSTNSSNSSFESARLALELAQSLDPDSPTLWLIQGIFNSAFLSQSIDHSINPSTDQSNQFLISQRVEAAFERSVSINQSTDGRLGLCYAALYNCTLKPVGKQSGKQLNNQSASLFGYHALKLTEQSNSQSVHWVYLAVSLINNRHFDEAYECLTKAETLINQSIKQSTEQPDSQSETQFLYQSRCVKWLLSIVFCERNHINQAIKHAERVLDLDKQLSEHSINQSVNQTKLDVYHHLIKLHQSIKQYDQAKQIIVTAMSLITEQQQLDEEEEQNESSDQPIDHSISQTFLLDSYHSFLLSFVDCLIHEKNYEEAVHHTQSKLDEYDAEDEDDEPNDQSIDQSMILRKLDLYQRYMSISVKQSNKDQLKKSINQSIELCVQLTDQTIKIARLIDCLHQSIESLNIMNYSIDCETYLVQMIDLVNKQPFYQSINQRTFLLDIFNQHFTDNESIKETIKPLIQHPSLTQLHSSNEQSIDQFYQTLSRAYQSINQLTPSGESLSHEYEVDQSKKQSMETAELLGETVDDPNDESSTGQSVDDPSLAIDDDVRTEYDIPLKLMQANQSDKFDRLLSSGQSINQSNNQLSTALKASWLMPSIASYKCLAKSVKDCAAQSSTSNTENNFLLTEELVSRFN